MLARKWNAGILLSVKHMSNIFFYICPKQKSYFFVLCWDCLFLAALCFACKLICISLIHALHVIKVLYVFDIFLSRRLYSYRFSYRYRDRYSIVSQIDRSTGRFYREIRKQTFSSNDSDSIFLLLLGNSSTFSFFLRVIYLLLNAYFIGTILLRIFLLSIYASYARRRSKLSCIE